MKQIFGALAIAGLLLGSGIAAHAQFVTDFTVVVPSLGGGANNLISGVSSDHSIYNATLTPSVPQDYDYTGATTSFGVTQQGGGGNGINDTFTNKDARFTFDVIANGVTQSVQVIGRLDGTTKINASGVGGGNTHYTVTSLNLFGGPLVSNIVTSPNGRISLELAHVQFNNAFANIFVEQLNALTVPNAQFGNTLSVGGYLVQDVPEPGSVALLLGMGVPALGLLARRRRAR